METRGPLLYLNKYSRAPPARGGHGRESIFKAAAVCSLSLYFAVWLSLFLV